MRPVLRSTAIAIALAFSGGALADEQQKRQQQQSNQQQTQQQGKSQGSQKQGIVSATGKVMGNTDLKSTAGDMHQLVKLQRSDGGTVVVDLGIGGPQVDQGDRLFVSGHSARINGRPVIFARYAAKLQDVGNLAATPDTSAAGGTTAGDGDAVWNDDDWRTDDFGYYDDDFNWTADNSDFTEFYGDADDDWSGYYDDVGDEGLFDV